MSEAVRDEFDTLEWLLAHHFATEQERQQMTDDLQLKPGDVVLDLGCGPGLWTALLAERVKPNGKVIGLDNNGVLIDYARQNIARTEQQGGVLEFVVGDIDRLGLAQDMFDVVFLANSLCCATDMDVAIAGIKRMINCGGRLIVNNFDDAIAIYHPVAPALTLSVLAAVARALEVAPQASTFDNYLGRKTHGLLKRAGLRGVVTKIYPIQKTNPLNIATKHYIRTIASWQARIGRPFLSREDFDKWSSHFDPASECCILDSAVFYYSGADIQTIGTMH